MKRLIACFLALCTSIAFGATTVPIQLLNTTGSTSGQTVISNGPSVAATWGNVSATTLNGVVPVANGGTGVTTSTGAGSVVLSTSPTLATPNLGTPSAVTLTNGTGLPISTGV
jgi:hypothetical protein